MREIQIATQEREAMIDVTRDVRRIVEDSGVREGVVVIQSVHTTLGVTVNENADPDVQRDFLFHLGRMVPRDPNFVHGENNSDSHIKVSLTSPSLSLIVDNGDVLLGTWQGIYALEFDGPRRRRLYVQVVETGGRGASEPIH